MTKPTELSSELREWVVEILSWKTYDIPVQAVTDEIIALIAKHDQQKKQQLLDSLRGEAVAYKTESECELITRLYKNFNQIIERVYGGEK